MPQTAADILKTRLGKFAPKIAIVLGSSLGPVADAVDDPVVISYAGLPGFPKPSVSGHASELVAGHLGGVPVAILKGRAHAYEFGNAAVMRPAIEALAGAGFTTLVLTNAAGSLRTEVGPGQLMLLTDHINLSGMNPLIGEEGDKRFVSLTNAYDSAHRDILHKAAKATEIPLAEGVYAWFSGPCFETPAEIKMARVLGADAVGMSTAPETILARFFGLKVAAISVITNLGAGMDGASPSHEETKEQGVKAVGDLTRLLVTALPDLSS